MTDPIIWRPTQETMAKANVTRFMKRHEIKDYDELIQRSTTGIEWFWDSCVHETNIEWFEPYMQLLDERRGISDARWFVGGRINIVHNCVDRHASKAQQAKKK